MGSVGSSSGEDGTCELWSWSETQVGIAGLLETVTNAEAEGYVVDHPNPSRLQDLSIVRRAKAAIAVILILVGLGDDRTMFWPITGWPMYCYLPNQSEISHPTYLLKVSCQDGQEKWLKPVDLVPAGRERYARGVISEMFNPDPAVRKQHRKYLKRLLAIRLPNHRPIEIIVFERDFNRLGQTQKKLGAYAPEWP